MSSMGGSYESLGRGRRGYDLRPTNMEVAAAAAKLEVKVLSRACRILLVLVAALATASSAAADGTPPTVTLLAPANGTTLTLDGKHDTTFSWRLDFAQPQTEATTITFMVSADPTFQGPHYTESRACDTASPACFTSTTLRG